MKSVLRATDYTGGRYRDSYPAAVFHWEAGQSIYDAISIASEDCCSGITITLNLVARRIGNNRVFIVTYCGSALRKHERMLAQTREKSLRDEHLVPLGTLAAGAAHELGTPLGSILIISKELNEEFGDAAPELRDQLQLLSAQVERCRNTLALLSSSAGQLRAEQVYGLPLNEYLRNVVGEWRALRPAVGVYCQIDGVQPSPMIIDEKTLSQAIINILNNAADASSEPVEVDASWNELDLSIEVRDRGNSLTQNISDKAGEPAPRYNCHYSNC